MIFLIYFVILYFICFQNNEIIRRVRGDYEYGAEVTKGRGD